MKTLNLAAAALIILLLGCHVVLSQSTNSQLNADAAWQELQQAALLTAQPRTNEQVAIAAAAAVAASEKAEAFYKQFPDNTNALAARILECKMLQTAYYHGNPHVFVKWLSVQANLVPDPGLTADERFDLRLPVIRELIKRYPAREKPYEMLLDLAAISPDDKARPIADELLTDPVSDSLKDQARDLLRRLDSVGKPLDITFKALDGREVDLNRMKGQVVVLDFWATWCVSCVAEMPMLKETYEKYHSRGFDIVGISSDTNEKACQNFLEMSP